MKLLFLKLFTVFSLVLQFTFCGSRFPSEYTLELPKTPNFWVSLLGEPHWRLEWLNPGGQKQTMDIPPGKTVKIGIPTTWTNPVTAWPFWPDHNLIPGLFKPAGALFPFDTSGSGGKTDRLRLRWKTGPDTVFYWELASSLNSPDSMQNSTKIPANFDWPRFRELFNGDKINESVCKDPWLVDWHSAAEKTINSNFDQRRLVPEPVESLNVPAASGLWYGTSPFSSPLHFKNGEPSVFPIRPGLNVWVSSAGILRCNNKTWVLSEWK
jgi:hypothetical protein